MGPQLFRDPWVRGGRRGSSFFQGDLLEHYYMLPCSGSHVCFQLGCNVSVGGSSSHDDCFPIYMSSATVLAEHVNTKGSGETGLTIREFSDEPFSVVEQPLDGVR